MAGRRRGVGLGSVRARTALGAALVVSLACAAGALILVTVLSRSLVASVDLSVRLRAEAISSLLRSGALPAVLPKSGQEETAFEQVVGPAGTVVASSPEVEGEGPILIPGAVANGRTRTINHAPIEGDRSFRLLARTVSTPTGTFTIYTAGSLTDVDHSVAVVARGLATGGPVLLLVVTALTWMVVGRALSPVEAIRAEVARISTLALDRRVPEPAVADEIGRLAHTMNDMIERLSAADLAQRRFVADAAHELRSPLAAIHTQLEVGLAHADSIDWDVIAAEVFEDVARLRRLAEQLLALARAEGPATSRRPVDLDDVVLAELGRAKDTSRVVVDGSGVSAARVIGDRDQLHQVVRNLVDNACRHACGRVLVALRSEADTAVLTVADDGSGIPAAERERVFERFTRLDEARAADAGGSGLGLAIVRRVLTAHGGAISVEDAPVGASMVVRLPLEPPS